MPNVEEMIAATNAKIARHSVKFGRLPTNESAIAAATTRRKRKIKAENADRANREHSLWQSTERRNRHCARDETTREKKPTTADTAMTVLK